MKIFILTCALNGRLWVPKRNHVLPQKRRKTTLETTRINIKLMGNRTENDHPQHHNICWHMMMKNCLSSSLGLLYISPHIVLQRNVGGRVKFAFLSEINVCYLGTHNVLYMQYRSKEVGWPQELEQCFW